MTTYESADRCRVKHYHVHLKQLFNPLKKLELEKLGELENLGNKSIIRPFELM